MPNIYDFDHLYRRIITEKVGSDDPHYIKLDPVPPHMVRVLNRVTVENTTLDYTKCRLGIYNGGVFYYLDELDDPAADELAVSTYLILLGEGDAFFAELTGVAADEDVILTCTGWQKEI